MGVLLHLFCAPAISVPPTSSRVPKEIRATTTANTFVVTTLDNGSPAQDGKLSLLEAVTKANATTLTNEGVATEPAVIVFDSQLQGDLVISAERPLEITGNVDIQGPGVEKIALTGPARSFGEVRDFGGTTLRLSGLKFRGGTSPYGGTICNYGNLIVENCAFESNSSIDPNPTSGTHRDLGGAIYNIRGQATLTDCLFKNNSAFFGSAVYNDFGTLNLTRCVFESSLAQGGGAVLNNGSGMLDGTPESGLLNVSQCTFKTNAGQRGTGGIINFQAQATITDSSFIGNTAQQEGGAIRSRSGWLFLTNCTFTGNQALNTGGAVRVDVVDRGDLTVAGTATVLNCTFYRNSAGISGGAIAVEGVPTRLVNSAVTLNMAPEAANLYGAANVVKENCYLGSEPRLSELGWNGGPTKTFLPLPGSPLLDAGNDNPTDLALPANDQRGTGFTRRGGSHVDIGAVELSHFVSISNAQNAEGDGGSRLFTFPVRLSAPLAVPIEVAYTTVDGTATKTSDYGSQSGTLRFEAGVTERIIAIKVLGDIATEPDETFFVRLAATPATPPLFAFSKSSAKATIVNDDNAVYDTSRGRVAFLSSRNGLRGIYIMNADGTQVTRLTDGGPAGSGDHVPILSRNGKKIVFFSGRDGNYTNDIYIIDAFLDANGAVPKIKKVPFPNGVQAEAYMDSLSVDSEGSHIAFIAKIGTNLRRDLCLMKTDGSGFKNLTQGQLSSVYHPVWSPDSTKILFNAQFPIEEAPFSAQRFAIWNVATGQIRQLPSDGSLNSGTWSPDGKQICYSDGILKLVDADGTNSRPLGLDSPSHEDGSSTSAAFPSWSVDGKEILFDSNREGNVDYRMYAVRPDGSGLRQLTNPQFDGLRPSCGAWVADPSESSGLPQAAILSPMSQGVAVASVALDHDTLSAGTAWGTAQDRPGGNGLYVVTAAVARYASAEATTPQKYLAWESGTVWVSTEVPGLTETVVATANDYADWTLELRPLLVGFYGLRVTVTNLEGNQSRTGWVRFSTQIPRYTVRGHVYSHVGLPLQGVTVTRTSDLGVSVSTQTDANGAYVFSGPPGRYKIKPTRENMGFLAPYRQIEVKQDNLTDLDFYGLRAPFLRGRVTDFGGNGVGMVTVTATSNATTLSELTARDGYYGFERVAPGKITLTATSDSYRLTPTSREVTVVGTTSQSDLNFTAIRVGSQNVTGRVLNESGQPQAGVAVSLMSNGVFFGTRLTDAQGRYSFANVAPGTYRVTPEFKNHQFVPVSRDIQVQTAGVEVPDFRAIYSFFRVSGQALTAPLPLTGVEKTVLANAVLFDEGAGPRLGITAFYEHDGVQDGVFSFICIAPDPGQSGSFELSGNFHQTGAQAEAELRPYSRFITGGTYIPYCTMGDYNEMTNHLPPYGGGPISLPDECANHWSGVLSVNFKNGRCTGNFAMRTVPEGGRELVIGPFTGPAVTRDFSGDFDVPITDIRDVGAASYDARQSGAPPPLVKSSANLRLSAIHALATTQSVLLNFSGTLDAMSALTASHYEIEVNNAPVTPEKLSLHGQGNSVTLHLPQASLRANELVTVRWLGLRTADGRTLSGQITSTVR